MTTDADLRQVERDTIEGMVVTILETPRYGDLLLADAEASVRAFNPRITAVLDFGLESEEGRWYPLFGAVELDGNDVRPARDINPDNRTGIENALDAVLYVPSPHTAPWGLSPADLRAPAINETITRLRGFAGPESFFRWGTKEYAR